MTGACSTAGGGGPGWPFRGLLAEGEREAQEILRLALRSAHESLLGGSWTRVRDSVQTDLAYRNHLVVTQGIGPALTTVIPGLRWSGTVLEIPRSRSVELHLRGGGITLLPTAFWTGPPLFSRPVQDRPMLIVYPATPLPLIIDAGAEPTRALAALLGRTRAAVLEAITAAPATTSELARRLNISPGRASEHASVLRDAGLITSHRHRNRVLHTATPLSLRIGTPAR